MNLLTLKHSINATVTYAEAPYVCTARVDTED